MNRSIFEMENAIDREDFFKIFTPDLKKVISIVRKYGVDIRVVGGAVRDFILGRSPRDVDFATNAEPAELMFIFDLEGIDHDDGGIAHGTIKPIINGEKIDITSINYRLKLKGNKISIDRKNSWEHDSARRDLTINSMSVDMDGILHDYREGLSDLQNQLVRFNPGAQEKINEDPYVMLRWFKAISIFENPKWIKKDRLLITRNSEKIPDISHLKKVGKLLTSMKQSTSWSTVNHLMCGTGVAKHLDIDCPS